MTDVGINIKATENISSIAPTAATGLRNISTAAEDMKKALQLGDLEQQYKAFADRVDKMYDIQHVNRAGAAATGTPGAGAAKGGGFQQAAGQATGLLRSTGTSAQRLGQSGDAVGVGADALSQLGGLLKGLGPVGAAIAGVGALTFAGNAVSRQYEEVLPEVMETTAQLGRLGKTAKETSLSFVSTMDEVSNTAAKFGYGLEQGTKIFQELAKAGAPGTGIAGEAGQAMTYARGYGISASGAARFLGTGRRFGMQGNLLGMAAGGLEQSGMGPARFQEFLDATLSVFEEGLSRGLVKGFGEITATQAWIGQMGEQYTGQAGLNLYRKMESAVSGATGLQSESDAMLFRAARRVVGKDAGYVDVMKYLEKGISANLFNEVMADVNNMAGNETDKIELLRNIFGVQYGVAEDLLGLEGKEAAARIKSAPKVTETEEVRLLKAQNNIMEQIRLMGTKLMSAKMFVLEGADKVIEGLSGVVGAKPNRQKAEADYQEWLKMDGEGVSDAMENLHRSGRYNNPIGLLGLAEAMKNAMRNPTKFGMNNLQAAQQLGFIFKGLSEDDLSSLGGFKGEVRGYSYGLFDYLQQLGKQNMAPSGEWKNQYTGADLTVVLSALTNILNDLNINIAGDKNTSIFIEGGN